jgi:hypothetical protein
MAIINLCEAWIGQTKQCTVTPLQKTCEMDKYICFTFATDGCPEQFHIDYNAKSKGQGLCLQGLRT